MFSFKIIIFIILNTPSYLEFCHKLLYTIINTLGRRESLMLNNNTFSNSHNIIFASLLKGGQLFRRKICPPPPRSKFLPFTAALIFELASSSTNANRQSQKLLSFVNIAEIYGGAPIHLLLLLHDGELIYPSKK